MALNKYLNKQNSGTDTPTREKNKKSSVIDDFRGEHFFLSNYCPCSVQYGEFTYGSSEAAFQAQKVTDHESRRIFCRLTPSEAKRYGRMVPLRKDWEYVKDHEMEMILEAKFSQEDLRRKLIATGDAELIEGNTWGDTYWGVCNGRGKNMLGKLLMQLRDKLKDQYIPAIRIDDIPTDCHECGAFFEGECSFTGNNYGLVIHHRPCDCPIILVKEKHIENPIN